MKSFGRIAASAVAASALAISSVAEETAVAFDFEDLQAQSAAQEDKVDKARTVLHEIFSNYCVEKLVKASVNIRDDGRPDVEINPDTKNFKITFRLAVDEEAYNNWLTNAKAKLSEIADKTEDSGSDWYLREDECVLDGKKYTFDERIHFEYCVRMFTPARENMFRFEILSKTGEELYGSSGFFLQERNWENPLPKPMRKIGRENPCIKYLNLGECDFLPKIKEIRCSFGRIDDSKFTEMEKAHPVVKVPLKWGVTIDMAEIKPGLYCSKLPLTLEQAFACGFGTTNDREAGYMRFIKYSYYPESQEEITKMKLSDFIKAINDSQSDKDAGYIFRIPTESEWMYAAKGGSSKDATFGLLPNGDDQMFYAPGWFSDKNYGDGKARSYLNSRHTPLGQKMPNAFGLHDMVGMYDELCVAENKYGDTQGKMFCNRMSVFPWKSSANDASYREPRSFNYQGRQDEPSFYSIRLFATKKGTK